MTIVLWASAHNIPNYATQHLTNEFNTKNSVHKMWWSWFFLQINSITSVRNLLKLVAKSPCGQLTNIFFISFVVFFRIFLLIGIKTGMAWFPFQLSINSGTNWVECNQNVFEKVMHPSCVWKHDWILFHKLNTRFNYLCKVSLRSNIVLTTKWNFICAAFFLLLLLFA